MVDTPERTPEAPPVSEVVKEIPETPEIPPHIEREGVQAAPTQVTAQVTDDTGQQLIQTPATKPIIIQIPETHEKLEELRKGLPADAITWLATFWLRMLKKAAHFGWRIISGKGD